jgi:hypothetical protein
MPDPAGFAKSVWRFELALSTVVGQVEIDRPRNAERPLRPLKPSDPFRDDHELAKHGDTARGGAALAVLRAFYAPPGDICPRRDTRLEPDSSP